MQTTAHSAPRAELRMPRAAAVRVEVALAEVAELENAIRAAQARQLELIAEASDAFVIDDEPAIGLTAGEAAELARRSFAAELAVTLRVHERTANGLVDEAGWLEVSGRATRAMLGRGEISMAHAREVIAQVLSVPEDARPALEAALLERAATRTPAQFRRIARRLRERMHPESGEIRRTAARAERRLWVEPADDGMAWLHLFIEAERAIAIEGRVRDLAGRAAGDRKAMGADLADVATALLLTGIAPTVAGEHLDDEAWRRVQSSIRPTVHVTVPVLALLGIGDAPAELEGYGPIDSATATALAGNATSWRRILTHPETGAFLSYGRDTYRVPADLAGYVRVRDGTCRFPNCSRPASRTDLDHTDDWADGGATDAANLACLCRAHHRVKHHGGWRVRQLGGGRLEWTSPTGRVHVTEPEYAFAQGAGVGAGP